MSKRNKTLALGWLDRTIHGLFVLMAALLMSSALTACGSSDGAEEADASADMTESDVVTGETEGETTGETTDPGTAKVRAIHLSPDAPAVDVLYNDETTPLFADVPYKAAGPFTDVPAGTYDLHVVPAGGSKDDAVLSATGLDLMKDRAYTAVAYGALGSIAGLALEDDLTPPAAGKIRVRAVHTAKDVPSVDIWLIADTPAKLYAGVPFGAAGDYLPELDADTPLTLGFDILDGMGVGDGNPDLLFDLPGLPAGTIATIFALSDDSGVFLYALFADSTTARIDPKP